MMHSLSSHGGHGNASDTFIDTDSGGLAEGDAVALHEEDLGDEDEGEEDSPANVGLDLSAPALPIDPLAELLAAPTTVGATDFSLEGLLAESMSAIAESASIKAARKKLKDTRISKAERAALEEKIQVWEVQREWTPKATVAMFAVQTCACGSHYRFFSGLFQRQEHRLSSVTRWVHAEEIADSGLPREVKTYITKVPLCDDCVRRAGYADIS